MKALLAAKLSILFGAIGMSAPLALVLRWVAWPAGVAALILGLLALVLAFISLNRQRSSALAMAGAILGVVAVLGCVAWLLLLGWVDIEYAPATWEKPDSRR